MLGSMAGLGGGGGGVGGGFTVTPDEVAKFQVQFNSLPVVGGKLNGDAARTFFMRSGLSAQVTFKLGRILIEHMDIICRVLPKLQIMFICSIINCSVFVSKCKFRFWDGSGACPITTRTDS